MCFCEYGKIKYIKNIGHPELLSINIYTQTQLYGSML